MEPSFFQTGVVVTAIYVWAGLVPDRWGRWRPVALGALPALVAWGLVGWHVHLSGLIAALVWAASATGYLAQTRAESGSRWIAFQVAALLCLVGLLAWAHPASDAIPSALVALACTGSGLVVAVAWGGAFVGRAIKPFTDALYEAPPQPEGLIPTRGLPQGFATGGKTIGRWERLLIFLFVLADAPTAIGFLVTAKSILRFGEIKDRTSQREAEYIIIGTLMSFGFALVASYLTRLALLALLPEDVVALFKLSE